VGLCGQVHGNGPVLDDEILADSEVQDAIKNEGSIHRKFKILNTDRATLGRVGGAVAKLHGDSGFAGSLSFDMEVILHDEASAPVVTDSLILTSSLIVAHLRPK